MRRSAILLLTACCFAQKPAPPGPPPATGTASDPKVTIDATLYLNRDDIKRLLGEDIGENYVLVEVKVQPSSEDGIKLDRDDFLLRSDKTGATARPMEATQIAGTSVMVINSKSGEPTTPKRRLSVGIPGIGGTSREGAPAQAPTVSAPAGETGGADASAPNKPPKANPLLDTLKEKILPEGETTKAVSGYLYFILEGKQKVKDVELVYRKAPPRIHIRFKEPTKK
jgi:hypothetical protein